MKKTSKAITPFAHSWKGVNGPPSRSQGDTFEEARINIQEAVGLYLETLTKDEITERLSLKLPILDAKEVKFCK